MRRCIYIYKWELPGGVRHTICVGLMCVQRRRRWTGIGPALARRLQFDAFPGPLK